MIPFLKSVAHAYASRYPDLSRFCFLFPNKRSGTFFLKFLQEECHDRVFLAPEVTSQQEFVTRLSRRVVASRLDQIFLLFEAYRSLSSSDSDQEDAALAFDAFRVWGETVLSDFNEVDQYLVNPDEIFKNVKDFREITSNFLTDDQKAVMEEYFGRTDYGDSSRFWKNFDSDEDKDSEVKRRFLHLWRIMGPLYHAFHDRLGQLGLATTGSVYRIALQRLREEGRSALPYDKIVVVGFNALSTAERAIFAEMRDFNPVGAFESFADFFWDATGPVLDADLNSASKFVKSNIKAFPCPEWALPSLRLSDSDKLPDAIRVIASPSNSAQTKIAGSVLARLRSELSGDEFKQAKVAVVLPDENLLLPMLYSFPPGMGDVNLTMGYPLRMTSVVPFVSSLRRLYSTMRTVNGRQGFYHRDLRLFLAHPFSHALFGSDVVARIVGWLNRHHSVVMSVDEISEISPEVSDVLSSFHGDLTPTEVTACLDRILNSVAASLEGKDSDMIKSRLEVSHINVYRDALRRLQEILAHYRVGMRPQTVFRLVDRLLAGETVGFEGEPLSGLQVMGMLETRSLDFDHIVILSANERVLPLRSRTRSFIPNTLRHGHAMPPSNYAEEIFAYYFYRMISRAKSVTLVYDARSGAGLRSGDVSRYILQLRHLFAKDRIEEQDWKFTLSGKIPYDPSVVKTGDIMSQLEPFLEPDTKHNLSASALSAYRRCPVQFFYQSVMGINTDPEPTESIDAITGGNILHDLMLQLYVAPDRQHKYLEHPILITENYLRRLIEDEESLKRMVTRAVNKNHSHLPDDQLDRPLTGSSGMIAPKIMGQVLNVLRHDLSLAPFKVWGCEISETLRVPLLSGRVVNFRFAIDRLDEIMVDGHPQLRIVDYKTGGMKLEAEDIDNVVNGDYHGDQIFQLFTYAWLHGKRPGAKHATTDVRTEIYNVNEIHLGVVRLPKIGKKTVTDFNEFAVEFGSAMETMIDGIFTLPRFEAPAVESGVCDMCSLKTLCRR